VFEWFKCSSYPKKGQSKSNHFWLPYIDDGTGAVVDSSVCTHVICTWGLQFLLDIGMQRYQSIWMVSTFTALLSTHKTVGKPPPHALEINERKYEPLMRYFEYMSNLGEVRVTKVVATFIDEMLGHANCNQKWSGPNTPPNINGVPCMIQAIHGIVGL
jgi:hypothetical protein